MCWRRSLLFKWNVILILSWDIRALEILGCGSCKNTSAALAARFEKEAAGNEDRDENDKGAIQDHVAMIRDK